MVKLNERKIRWIIQEKLRGRGAGELADWTPRPDGPTVLAPFMAYTYEFRASHMGAPWGPNEMVYVSLDAYVTVGVKTDRVYLQSW